MTVCRDFRALCVLLAAAIACAEFSGCNQSSAFMMNESGKSLYAQGQFTAARREFERALMDNPENPDYAFNVASAMRKQGDLIGAERMFRHAVTLDPRHQPAHHGLASLLVDQGRVAEADSHLREWADTQPYLAEAHIENAWLKRDMGDAAAAEQALRQALQADPRHPVALAHLGELYEMNGQPDAAQALYQRSLAGNPLQSEIKARMADSLRGWSGPGGVATAAYPPQGNWAALPMQQASYAAPPIGSVPTSMPFQGFASTYGPHPSAAGYGQPAMGGAYPQSAPGATWPVAAPQTYATPAMPAQLGHPQPITNADPAHIPGPQSAVPLVTPF